MQRWIIFVVTTLVGLVLDLGTKALAFNHDISGLVWPHGAERSSIVVIPGWFEISLAMNTGAAFSLFRGKFTFFVMISVVAVLALTYFNHIAKKDARLQPFLLGLVLGGVIGNFWDRVTYEGVRDFIAIHTPPDGFLIFPHYEWPTFNVADIWICVGAIALAWLSWKEETAREAARAAAESAAADSKTGSESVPA